MPCQLEYPWGEVLKKAFARCEIISTSTAANIEHRLRRKLKGESCKISTTAWVSSIDDTAQDISQRLEN